MKLNFKIALIEVAKENTLCAKVFKTITAKEQEIPIRMLDKKINCFGVIND